MKKIVLSIIFVWHLLGSYAQETDSLLYLLASTTDDTVKVKFFGQLSRIYRKAKPDTAMLLAQEGLELAKQVDFPLGQARLLNNVGDIYVAVGDYTQALEAQLESLDIYKRIKATREAGKTLHAIALLYEDQEDLKLTLSYFLEEYKTLVINSDPIDQLWNLLGLSRIYIKLKMVDSSNYYSEQAMVTAKNIYNNNLPGDLLNTIADLFVYRRQYNQALTTYRQSALELTGSDDYREICIAYLGIAKLLKNAGKFDSSIFYAKKSLLLSQQNGLLLGQLSSYGLLVDIYKSHQNIDSAFFYQQLNNKIHDSLFGAKKVREFQNTVFANQMEQHRMRSAEAAYRSRVKIFVLAAGVLTFLVITLLLIRINRHKQKANFLLNKQKVEIDQQKLKIERAYMELQSAQAHLVQSEKMAGLGQLTAGIAHEIQNPLNFVNNFSEVNNDLLDELKKEADNGNWKAAAVLVNDLKENELKILAHGKKADAIVKGMLQHSHAGSGVKEPTDINALCDEYLRLSYHSYRAKDKSQHGGQAGFYASLQTDFDRSIGDNNIFPQEIGRVILNLLNNAFYAVNEKRKQQPEILADGVAPYQPTVYVSTKKMGDNLFITVKDNGNGIPPKILNKIFQPFFTTKPAGQGTGLGLSLSYDIIKAHGGEIKVESEEWEGLPSGQAGTTFIIQLPFV